MTTLSSLLLKESPLNSSTDTLQLSSDGQIAIATRGAIFFLTPDFRETKPGISSGADLANSFIWTQTSIDGLGKTRLWCESNTQWRTASLGSLEVVWQAVAWSPSGLSKLGGCLLAALTNNLEVSIWAPVKNPLTGEWVKLQDVTQDQMSSFEQDSMSTENILQCQTCSIAWSSSVWEHSTTPTTMDSSLLALGSRSGNVNFFRWDLTMNSVLLCLTHYVANAWVVKLTWHKWKVNSGEDQTQTAHAHLACGLSDGSVWVLTVKYDPSSDEPYSILDSSIVAEADSRPIAAMAFEEVGSEHQTLLVFAKPGFVCLHELTALSENQMVEDNVVQTILLSSPRTSLASTPIAICTGFYYVPSDDCLIVILAEGSLNVIAEVSGAAHLKQHSDTPNQLSTSRLSRQMRRLTEAVEERPLELVEYAKIHGFQRIGASNYVVWAQELLQPYDLSFRVRAAFETRICMAILWETDQDATARIVGSVRAALLKNNTSIAYYSPAVLLRDAMFELLDPEVFVSAAPRLLPLLAPDWNPPSVNRPVGTSPTLPQQKASDASFIHLTRLKLSLTLFLTKRADIPDDLARRFQLAYNALLETAVALQIQSTVNRILATGDASSLDHASVRRFMHAAQYCPIPGTVVDWFTRTRRQAREHEFGMTKLQARDLSVPRVGLELFESGDIGEKCPACEEVVFFRDLERGRCRSGHVWERCATSLQLISDVGSLTCAGCGRKSLDEDPKHLARPGAHCILCGHRYFRAL